MSQFIVQGGRCLSGTIKPQGSKNEALQVVCAALLTDEKVVLRNLPDIADVRSILTLLQQLGVEVVQLDRGSFQFSSASVAREALFAKEFQKECVKIRGSIMLVAPLLCRFQEVVVPKPGGDRIGRRGLHAHFEGLEQLGVVVSYDPKENIWLATRKTLVGNSVLLPEASVTATASVVMMASRTKGKTTIYPAACEPHVQQLCHMLNAMGARITGIGTNLLSIEGVEQLGGTVHDVSSDALEVGSLIGLAAATKSELTITDVPVVLLAPIWNGFRKLGVLLETNPEKGLVHVPAQLTYHIRKEIDGKLPTLSDAIWPGFPADLISIAVVTAAHAQGHVLIHQKMFESRLFFVDYLIEMGARLVLCDPHRVHVVGLRNEYRLQGIRMSSSDIRAGIALLIAALAAEGESIIGNIEQIDRGYERIDERLRALGASLRRA